MRIKYYQVYDNCYIGNTGSSPDGFPMGSVIFSTLDKTHAQRVVDIMRPIAEKEGQFAPQLLEKEFIIDEVSPFVHEMSNDDIIDWMKDV